MKLKFIFSCTLLLCGAAMAFAQVTLNTTPTRVPGHARPEGIGTLVNYNPNLVEGREFDSPYGVAVDTSVSPPIVYVADSQNNRVLGWKNATSFTNGAFADLVIGQPDFYTTTPSGPATVFSAGLYFPTGLAVRNGDLYVVDSGNNRILRFPQPFSFLGQQQIPNLLIGQPNLGYTDSRCRCAPPNYPNGQPTANGIVTNSGSAIYTASIAFDSSGNLWFTDPGNRRVLRYPSSAVSGNPANFLAADFVLGQKSTSDFTDLLPALTGSTNCANNAPCIYTTSQFYTPSGIGFDAFNRLYVTDYDGGIQISRVVVFTNTNPNTAKIIGLFPQGTANPSADLINRTLLTNAASVFFVNDPSVGQDVGVVDAGSHRILMFPPFEKWTDPQVAPPANFVIGQNGDFSNRNINNAPSPLVFPPPSGSTLWNPNAAVFFNNELYVADTGNNRVVVLPSQQGPTFGGATRVLGQVAFDKGSVNLIEGKEFQYGVDAGIAIDASGPVPHLYVADPLNNRVLGFRDLRVVSANTKADLVIGQPDMYTAVCNYQSAGTHGGDPSAPNQTSLCGPIGLTVDAKGNLYVADSLNARVLRFPAPFSASSPALEAADLVLGQRDFTSKFTDPSQFSMKRPYGLAFSATNGLLVSDLADNRVLYFPTTNGTFTSADNGKAATKVFGQGTFTGVASGSGAANLNAPRHIAADSDGFLYVADTGNNRIQIFNDPNNLTTPSTGASAVVSISDNLSSPYGVFVSQITGEVWVTDSGNSRAKRYARRDQLQLNGSANTIIPACNQCAPIAVAQDQFGDLLLADSSSRIGIYFPGLQPLNVANLLVTRALAPGTVAAICAPGSNVVNNSALPEGCKSGAIAFPNVTATQATSFPLPTTLGDVQVLFNGQPTPLYGVTNFQINFVVPMGKNAGDVPTSGTADIQVVRASTGQVLAAGSAPMSAQSPGIIQLNFTGQQRQAAVINADCTLNSSTNPAPRGTVVSVYGTGQGFIPGAPPDGTPASAPVSTPVLATVVIGACNVDDKACNGNETFEHVQYSGLNSFPGGWQVNVQIPQSVPVGVEPIFVGMNGVFSSDAASANYVMVIYVK